MQIDPVVLVPDIRRAAKLGTFFVMEKNPQLIPLVKGVAEGIETLADGDIPIDEIKEQVEAVVDTMVSDPVYRDIVKEAIGSGVEKLLLFKPYLDGLLAEEQARFVAILVKALAQGVREGAVLAEK